MALACLALGTNRAVFVAVVALLAGCAVQAAAQTTTPPPQACHHASDGLKGSLTNPLLPYCACDSGYAPGAADDATCAYRSSPLCFGWNTADISLTVEEANVTAGVLHVVLSSPIGPTRRVTNITIGTKDSPSWCNYPGPHWRKRLRSNTCSDIYELDLPIPLLLSCRVARLEVEANAVNDYLSSPATTTSHSSGPSNSVPPPGTCQRNLCGQSVPAVGGCFCDDVCADIGDCCSNYESVCGDVANAAPTATTESPTGSSPSLSAPTCVPATCGAAQTYALPSGDLTECFCDDLCVDNGDCCPGYATACTNSDSTNEQNSSPCPPEACGTLIPAASGCYCGPLCASFGDCCPTAAADCPVAFPRSSTASRQSAAASTDLAVYLYIKDLLLQMDIYESPDAAPLHVTHAVRLIGATPSLLSVFSQVSVRSELSVEGIVIAERWDTATGTARLTIETLTLWPHRIDALDLGATVSGGAGVAVEVTPVDLPATACSASQVGSHCVQAFEMRLEPRAPCAVSGIYDLAADVGCRDPSACHAGAAVLTFAVDGPRTCSISYVNDAPALQAQVALYANAARTRPASAFRLGERIWATVTVVSTGPAVNSVTISSVAAYSLGVPVPTGAVPLDVTDAAPAGPNAATFSVLLDGGLLASGAPGDERFAVVVAIEVEYDDGSRRRDRDGTEIFPTVVIQIAEDDPVGSEAAAANNGRSSTSRDDGDSGLAGTTITVIVMVCLGLILALILCCVLFCFYLSKDHKHRLSAGEGPTGRHDGNARVPGDTSSSTSLSTSYSAYSTTLVTSDSSLHTIHPPRTAWRANPLPSEAFLTTVDTGRRGAGGPQSWRGIPRGGGGGGGGGKGYYDSSSYGDYGYSVEAAWQGFQTSTATRGQATASSAFQPIQIYRTGEVHVLDTWSLSSATSSSASSSSS